MAGLGAGCAARSQPAVVSGPTAAMAVESHGPTYPGKIGLELDGPWEGSRTKAFADLGKVFRPWMATDSDKAAPTDARGWPTSDARAVFFDMRPFPAWAPPVDDPDAFQPDWSGTYYLSFTGQALIQPSDTTRITLSHQTYNVATNTTTTDVVVPPGMGLLVLSFTQTRRTPSSPVGSGLTNLHLIRPGYPLRNAPLFTTEFLRSLRPFSTLRFMDWLATNDSPGYYGDPGHHALEWADRHVPSDATQQSVGGKHGVAWEYVVALANQTGKDIWINIPVAATDDYVHHLAQMLKADLKPGLKIYIEHSNEVWNFGFPQYTYNKLAAIDEVQRGGSPLNNDGSPDQEVWAHRRHAERLVAISRIFQQVYGAGALGTTIRPVYASWLISPDPHFADVLAWVNKTYGPPGKFFYAVADAAYFNAQKASATAGPAEILASMRADSDNNRAARNRIQAIADQWHLKHFQYEVGPDTGGGSTVNVANRIRANRDAGMEDVILHDARDNWFAQGGDLYMYFASPSAYSRYGCWGLSEDIADLTTPKWQAIYALSGVTPPRKTTDHAH